MCFGQHKLQSKTQPIRHLTLPTEKYLLSAKCSDCTGPHRGRVCSWSRETRSHSTWQAAWTSSQANRQSFLHSRPQHRLRKKTTPPPKHATPQPCRVFYFHVARILIARPLPDFMASVIKYSFYTNFQFALCNCYNRDGDFPACEELVEKWTKSWLRWVYIDSASVCGHAHKRRWLRVVLFKIKRIRMCVLPSLVISRMWLFVQEFHLKVKHGNCPCR